MKWWMSQANKQMIKDEIFPAGWSSTGIDPSLIESWWLTALRLPEPSFFAFRWDSRGLNLMGSWSIQATWCYLTSFFSLYYRQKRALIALRSKHCEFLTFKLFCLFEILRHMLEPWLSSELRKDKDFVAFAAPLIFNIYSTKPKRLTCDDRLWPQQCTMRIEGRAESFFRPGEVAGRHNSNKYE